MKTKKGIYFKDITNLVRQGRQNSNWSLVIGAGTSNPIFPSWPDLIRSMYQDIYGLSSNAEIDALISKFPLDSILQSLKNYSLLTDDQFNIKLSEALYKELWQSLDVTERLAVFNVLSYPSPGKGNNSDWQLFFRTMTDYHRNSTFYQIAYTLKKGYLKDIKPTSIINFNAESLLYTMLTSMLREHYASKGKTLEKNNQRLDIITRSISKSYSGRIPFFHIHGYLPVPFVKKRKYQGATDKLVFSEGEYLNLANNNFSWQSSVFLHSSHTDILIFIGLSFSDLNLRKWLSWTSSNKLKEINHYTGTSADAKSPTDHFWIRLKPSNGIEESLIENNVSHLGVRLIWIDSYSQIGEALALLVGILDK